jgi:hypothetical protein
MNTATVTAITDGPLCRARRATADLHQRARTAADAAMARARANHLPEDVVTRIGDVARDAVISGRATAGGAIGSAWTTIKRRRRAPSPGDAA